MCDEDNLAGIPACLNAYVSYVLNNIVIQYQIHPPVHASVQQTNIQLPRRWAHRDLADGYRWVRVFLHS